MSRNHPDEHEDPLLASARRVLTTTSNTFIVKPWRELMTTKNAAALAKGKEVKAAAKKVAAKTPPYKHTPVDAEQTGDFDPSQSPRADQLTSMSAQPNDAFANFAISQLAGGVDTGHAPVVQSDSDSVASDNHEGTTMTDAQTPELTDAQTPELTDAQKAAKAKADEKAAAIQAKMAEKEAKAAKAKAEKEAAKAERERVAAQKKAEKEAEKAQKAAQAAETGAPKDSTTSMKALAERVRLGLYTKGANGQLSANDEVAAVLSEVPVEKTVEFLLKALGHETNKYAHLNYGQQSMNLRNLLRGVVRKGTEVNGAKVTAASLAELRDSLGYKLVLVEKKSATAPAPAPAVAEVKEPAVAEAA